MSNPKDKLITILGPTATGKSQLGVKMAREFNGEIISADSRQVYRGLDIGSAKITPQEMKGVPHHLIDIASPRRVFTVAQFQKLAIKSARKIILNNKTPFLVGGSPFYIYSVTEGWKLPSVPRNQSLRQRLEKKKPEELFKMLKELDAAYAQKVDPFNARRLIRAIEIASVAGQVPPRQSQPAFQTLFLGLNYPLPELKDKIARRLNQRLKSGLIEEVETLRKIPLSWKRLEDFGLEYRWVAYYLQNKVDYPEMKSGIIQDSLKLVKHQLNWFKKDQRIHWLKDSNQARDLIRNFLNQ